MNEYYYGIWEDVLMLMEDENNYAKIRLFKSPVHATTYRNILVERDNLTPSKLHIGTVSLNEVFDLIPELTVMAEDFYESPLKIVVTDFKEDVIIGENEIYDSNALLN